MLSPSDLTKVIRDPSNVWYGPHQCDGCGQPIVKLEREKGAVSLDAPHDHHYPNHDWKEHECPKMPPHQLRVIEEKLDLAEKYRKLQAFTASETFRTLPIDEQDRLNRQQLIMLQYNDVLGERIAAFTA